MLPDSLVASFSASLLIAFWIINIHNLIKTQKTHRKPLKPSSIRPTESFHIYFAGFGTLVFWIDSILLPFITFTGFLSFLNTFPLRIVFQYDSIVQVGGLILLTAGYALFSWSVIARGRYAVSWDMRDDHKLVSWGPYRYVRHPSYLAYFLMFLGLVLTWLNLLTVLSLIAIPGYVPLAYNEEKILIERFGDEYRRYQEETGRFLPKLGKTRQKKL